MNCALFMPEDTPPANIIESHAGGADVYLVNGLISDCGKLVREGSGRFQWFDLSTLKEPFRIEGKKTMGYELAFDMADAAGRLEEAQQRMLKDVPNHDFLSRSADEITPLSMDVKDAL